MMFTYPKEFFKDRQWSRESAEHVVPIIIDLIKPKSVADIGCASGIWLSVFKQNGVDDVVGVDGEYVDREFLLIPKENFICADLTKPLLLNKKYDLVISLEVAEHLPEECSKMFVETLTKIAPVVVFSAAIPFQGGLNHLNERWPNYWVRLFENNGFVAVDCLRNKIWDNDKILEWYRQNMLMFIDKISLNKFSIDNNSLYGKPLSIVHPNIYLEKAFLADLHNRSIGEVISILPYLVYKKIKKTLGLI